MTDYLELVREVERSIKQDAINAMIDGGGATTMPLPPPAPQPPQEGSKPPIPPPKQNDVTDENYGIKTIPELMPIIESS